MSGKGKTRAGIYARQSHGSKKSIAEQTLECTRDAEAERLELVGVYEDTVSASRYATKARDDWPRLLADLEAGELDVVMIWESSRGDRTLESWAGFLELCRRKGVLIRVTDHGETYDVDKPRHWKILADDGVNNQYASEETRQRNLRTARLTAEVGKPNGPTPYGYERIYHPKTKEFLEQRPDPAEAAVVVEIIDRIADGEPIKPLAEELAVRGVPAPGKWRRGGGRWTPDVVRALARRKAYIGVRSHNGGPDTYDAVWPAIVDPARFRAANRVLDARAKQFWRSSRMRHMLTGVPVCAECGSVYAGSYTGEPKTQRYECRGRGCGVVDGRDLEELVLAYVLGRLARKDIYSKLRRQGEDADRELAAARAHADELRTRLEEWRDSAVRGETTPATMAKLERDLTAQITAADLKADRVGIPPAVRDLIDAGDELPERWAAMSMAAQRDVIAALVDVVVVRGRKGVKIPTEERVSITWKGTS